MIIDTHSHIYAKNFTDDIEDIIKRAKDANVEKILLPNIDIESIAPLHKLSESYPDYCLPMMGLHPTSITNHWKEDLKIIEKQFETHKYYAVGEIGIDLYWDKSLFKEQRDAFISQLALSVLHDLPIVIHSREATKECIDCLNEVGINKLRGVFHSFTGTKEELECIAPLDNFYIGINGVVTYKNSNLRDYLHIINIDRIVVETDAPYLPPVPYRGKRNEPSYTTYIVKELAKIYDREIIEIESTTTRNAKKLFSI